MKLWDQYITCQHSSGTLAAAAQRMLLRARCLRSAPADGIVEVYSAGSSEARAAPGIWKAVSMVDAAWSPEGTRSGGTACWMAVHTRHWSA
jgi:hypothetical protein